MTFPFFHKIYAEGRSVQLHLGHNFNWEWANLFAKNGVQFPFLVVFMPISNSAVNRMFRHFREKFGSVMIPANDMRNGMAPWIGKQYLLGLVADQNPGNPRRCYWYPFLNKMTAFYKGPEMSARRYNIPVVFGDIRKSAERLLQSQSLPSRSKTRSTSRKAASPKRLYSSLSGTSASSRKYGCGATAAGNMSIRMSMRLRTAAKTTRAEKT